MKAIITIYVLLFFVCNSFANNYLDSLETSKVLGLEEYNKLKEEIISKDSTLKLVPKNALNFNLPKKKRRSLPILNLIIRFLTFAAAIALILYILYAIFSRIQPEKKVDLALQDLSSVEDINEIDTRPTYDYALNTGDYRLAIRMQFIKVLQILSEKELISWEPNKTNRDYKIELFGKALYKNFEYLSYVYDNAWYGNKDITKDIFESYNTYFSSFINTNDEQ